MEFWREKLGQDCQMVKRKTHQKDVCSVSADCHLLLVETSDTEIQAKSKGYFNVFFFFLVKQVLGRSQELREPNKAVLCLLIIIILISYYYLLLLNY